jgi:hypothetical protein
MCKYICTVTCRNTYSCTYILQGTTLNGKHNLVVGSLHFEFSKRNTSGGAVEAFQVRVKQSELFVVQNGMGPCLSLRLGSDLHSLYKNGFHIPLSLHMYYWAPGKLWFFKCDKMSNSLMQQLGILLTFACTYTATK